MKTDT